MSNNPEQKVDVTGKKVLIVEDTVELAEVIQATLERMGMTTYHETHAGRALDIFRNQHPDLLLLDIALPDMLGWKLLDELKADDMRDQVRIIVISAYGDPANRLTGKLQEIDTYLVKPFSPDEVERAVRSVFAPDEE